ncbi:O-antigen ligase family protein [Kovacikia minuta CCNUW1]|uniref:O-antigen ligase family protein n=1 Tax=Kovacikia minuta TaxID=2931930 RepID=UPI001CCD8B26|nr:O-antigen ligase family protein [Kovacikia minuta]UBF26752.1 O-antigen ligase family protein [Kovacikia minuta CCNUW1]
MKRVVKTLIPYHRHPDPRLQTYWDGFQVALLVIPFSSLLGSVAISLISLILFQQLFRRIARRPVNRGFAIVAVLMVLSAALAYQKADAFLGLANFLPFFIIFAALGELIQTPAQLRRLAWILVITSVPVVVIGFGQKFGGWAGHVQLLGSIVDWQIDPTGNPPGRMASIFFYANVLASYLGVTFILSLGLWIEAVIGRQRAAGGRQKATKGVRCQVSGDRRNTEDGGENPFPTPHSPLPTPYSPIQNSKFKILFPLLLRSIFLTIALLGNAIALILTDSRNVWAISVLAMFAFAVYLGWRWLVAGVMTIAGAVLGAAFAPSPVREWLRAIVPAFFWVRLTDQLYPDRPVATLRTTQWKFAASLVQQHPWTGWGLRNFSVLYQEQMHLFIGHPHNLPLMLAAETGLPATLLFIGLVGWVVFKGSQLLHSWTTVPVSPDLPVPASQFPDRLIFFTYLTAFLGCALFNLLDITLFDVRINLIGWLLLAAICGMVYHPSSRVERNSEF